MQGGAARRADQGVGESAADEAAEGAWAFPVHPRIEPVGLKFPRIPPERHTDDFARRLFDCFNLSPLCAFAG